MQSFICLILTPWYYHQATKKSLIVDCYDITLCIQWDFRAYMLKTLLISLWSRITKADAIDFHTFSLESVNITRETLKLIDKKFWKMLESHDDFIARCISLKLRVMNECSNISQTEQYFILEAQKNSRYLWTLTF